MLTKSQFYQTVTRDAEKVGIHWKVWHILLYATASISGFIAFYAYKYANYAFGGNCLLFADLHFENDSSQYYDPIGPFPNNTPSFYNPQTDWGHSSVCNYCGFAFAYIAILAVIFMAFFLICSRGGSGFENDLMKNPFQLIVPMTVLTLITTICIGTGYLQLDGGLHYFCKQFNSDTSTSCDSRINVFTLIFYESEQNASLYINLADYAALVAVISWVLQLGLLLARIIIAPDFTIIRSKLIYKKNENPVDCYNH